MTHHYDVIIVGTGHGGASAAAGLRQKGFEGSIAMIGRDAHPPYERPPLSKEYLAGEKPFERLLIRPAQFWIDRGIDLVLGSEVSNVEPETRRIRTTDGAVYGFSKLIWAAGGNPRKLSCKGSGLAGIHSIRDRSDVDRIVSELSHGGKQIVVIGGGYIGLEAAAGLIKLGCRVTVLEAQTRILERVAGPEISAFYEAEHRAHGVALRTGVHIARLEGPNGKISRVILNTAEAIDADLVVVGIGIDPAAAPLIAAGASGANGVDVDEYCRTSLDDIYAIGDCAAHANGYADGAIIRVESVQNASDMAKCVASHICGEPVAYNSIPWFWSNQYDLRLQTMGINIGYDHTVMRGNPSDRSFSVAYLRNGILSAVDCVNNTKDYVQAKKLIAGRVVADIAKLADATVPLKTLA